MNLDYNQIMNIKVFVKIGRKQGVLGWDGERVTIGVDAAPIDGAANKKLVEVLSDWLGISKSQASVVKGHTARYKTVEAGVTTEEFNKLVEALPRLLKQGSLF